MRDNFERVAVIFRKKNKPQITQITEIRKTILAADCADYADI
jgi:hypothetical protein